MLAVLISGTQTTTKVTTQLYENNGKNGQETATKMYFIVILKAILHKEAIEKEWLKFGQNLLDLI